jgi:RND superfamily putative drug exporter
MDFRSLGAFLVRRRKWVLVAALVFFVAAGAYGGDVSKSLTTGGFSEESAESSQALRYLDDTLHQGTPNVVLLVTPTVAGTSVDDPAIVAAGQAITAELGGHEHMSQAQSYWSLGSAPPLRSTAGDNALVLGHLDGTEDEVSERIDGVVAQFDREDSLVKIQVGGQAAAYREVGTTIEHDLQTAEMIALPITLLVLVFVFRSVVAALLPLLGGAFAIVGTFVVLKLLAQVTSVSIFSLNLTTALGLGLAIDYSLFIVSRYREERAKGLAPPDAVIATVGTAGRSVVFSGLTVAVSLSALLLFPLPFLKSFAYAGVPVVAMAVIGSVLVLPALIAVLGDRVNALSIGRRAAADPDPRHSFWYRTAHRVMRRPGIVAIAATALLLFLALPFLRIAMGLPDDRVLPADANSRAVGDAVRNGYGSNEAGALTVVMPGADVPDAELDRYAVALSATPGVARVDARTGIYLAGRLALPAGGLTERFDTPDGEWISIVPSVEPVSGAGEEVAHAVRAVPAPVADRLVGGSSAELVDTKDGIFSRLPWALAFIAIATFILLLLSFGSLLVAAKAIVLNTLSLTATFGAMVWIFQEGHLSDWLDFTPTGMLDLTTPLLMFCIAFGMSMDYEVFLLSRIKEEHDHTGDNEESVAVGLARSGRIITAAAATIAVVFVAFASSRITFIKLFGIGLALAVVMDATIIRATLVPAFMKLAGSANWWSPAWLSRIVDRVGMSEVESFEADAMAAAAVSGTSEPAVAEAEARSIDLDGVGDAAIGSGAGADEPEPALPGGSS